MARLQQQRRGLQRKEKKGSKFSRKTQGKNARQKVRGPQLPSSIRRELNLGSRPHVLRHRDEEISREGEETEEEEEEQPSFPNSDVYEYEEDQAPEESGKNRRFDNVDCLEYELPSDFEDEEIEESAADGEEFVGLEKEVKHQASLDFGKRRRPKNLQTNVEEESDEIYSESNGSDLQAEDGDDDNDSNIESDGLDTSKHAVLEETYDNKQNDGLIENESERLEDGDVNRVKGSSDVDSERSEDGDVDRIEDNIDFDAGDVEVGDERHRQMLDAVRTPRKRELRDRRWKNMELVSEAYPESEFNINPAAIDNNSKYITIEDLMAPLQSTTGFGSLRKRMHQLEKKGTAVEAPLPKVLQERLTRKAGYEKSREEISKWQDLVKKNREAPSLVFTQRPNLTATTLAEIVSKFEPKTDFEKEMAALSQEYGLAEDTSTTATSLGFNKFTVDEVKERQERLAKMRSVLSYHEMKAKRMKKIKSKAYHRLRHKDRKGVVGQDGELDPESLKEFAMKAEFKRAQERLTLKHKNTSKWAKRIIKRGLKAKEDGSREALAEQLRTHSALTRKVQGIEDTDSSDNHSNDSDTDSGSIDENNKPLQLSKTKSKVLAKAKMETLKVLEGDTEAEIPKSGLFALPFMARAIEKKRKQAQSEAIAVLEQLEQLEYDNDNGIKDSEFDMEAELPAKGITGRLMFGDMAKSMSNGKEQEPDLVVEDASSSDDDDYDKNESVNTGNKRTIASSTKGKSEIIKISEEKKGLADMVAPNNSKKRKIKEGNHFEMQEQSLHMADGACMNHEVQRATALTVSAISADEDGGSLLDSCELNDFNVGLDNPWLYGTVSEKTGITTKPAQRDNTIVDKNSGPLIASVSFEEVNIAGGEKWTEEKLESRQDIVMSNQIMADDVGHEQPHSSTSDTSDEDDENVKEQDAHFSLENASQAELIQRAFAGDDVEAEFEQIKSKALNEEVPLGETGLSLPGWGQWTDVQKKKGPPLWILKQQEELQRKREQALNKRKDSKLKHVIISQKMDKKAEKFMLPTVPFPFTSRDVFEKSIRMPVGRDFNTDQAFRDMIRPAVVKDAGVIIPPIKYKLSQEKDCGASYNAKVKKVTQSKKSIAKRKGEKGLKGNVLD